MIKKIVFCTLRNNEGPKGGPGGVLYLQKEVLGKEVSGIQTLYQFNIWGLKHVPFRLQILINQILFFFKYCFKRSTYYITNDIDQAYLLSLMGKSYSLIFHNQGPVVQEYLNFGRKMSNDRIKSIVKKERRAFTRANTLHFPSRGAAEVYFENKYACCKVEEVNIGSPLYNMVIPQSIKEPKEVIEKKDESVVTLFSAGTLTTAKGQDRTIDYLCNNINLFDKPVRYILVGNGPLKEVLLQKLSDIAKSNKNFSYSYYEKLNHDDVMYLHSISDIYIMLHRLSIFDIATIEAMSQSSAIILSKTGGNIDFNQDENIIYPEEFSKNRITTELVESLKIKNYRVFMDCFSSNAYKKQYNSLIKRIVNN